MRGSAVLIHPLSLAAVLAAGLLAAAGAAAQSAPAARGVTVEPERTEVQWLQAIQAAAERLNYTGTIVYQRGGTVQSSRLVHYFDGSLSHERLQMLDGKRREYIRRGTEVQCLYPDTRQMRFERRLEQESFPAIGGGTPAEILQRYQLVVGGLERVAGIECRVLTLKPRDAYRYGHWLCVERVTGLPLKAQTLNERAEPLDQQAFVDLRIGERIDRNQIKPSWATDGWTVEKVETQPADLDRSGWKITPPEGFRVLRSVSRKMAVGESGRPAMQAVYSDGLASLSVFIEPGAGVSLPQEATMSHGPMNGFTTRINDALVTVVGEVPPATVRAVAASVSLSGASPAASTGAPPSKSERSR